MYFYTGANPLRRWPVPQLARKHLWPKLDLIVNVNFRMCSTGLQSDVLLPAAGYYEKIGLKYPQSLVPYVIFGDQAVQPLDEANSEFEIFALLAAQAPGARPRARRQAVQGSLRHRARLRQLLRAATRWTV